MSRRSFLGQVERAVASGVRREHAGVIGHGPAPVDLLSIFRPRPKPASGREAALDASTRAPMSLVYGGMADRMHLRTCIIQRDSLPAEPAWDIRGDGTSTDSDPILGMYLQWWHFARLVPLNAERLNDDEAMATDPGIAKLLDIWRNVETEQLCITLTGSNNEDLDLRRPPDCLESDAGRWTVDDDDDATGTSFTWSPGRTFEGRLVVPSSVRPSDVPKNGRLIMRSWKGSFDLSVTAAGDH